MAQVAIRPSTQVVLGTAPHNTGVSIATNNSTLASPNISSVTSGITHSTSPLTHNTAGASINSTVLNSSVNVSPLHHLSSPNQMLHMNSNNNPLPLQLPPLNLSTTSHYQYQPPAPPAPAPALQQQQQQQHQYPYIPQPQPQVQTQPQVQHSFHGYHQIIPQGTNYARSTSDLSVYSNVSTPQLSHNSLPSLNVVLNRIQSNSSLLLPSLTSYTHQHPISASSLSTTSSVDSDIKSSHSSFSHNLISSSSSSSSPPLTSSTTSLNLGATTTAGFTEGTPKRKYKCLKCNKGFTTSGHLARHNRIHTGVKNHVCPFEGCNSRFSRQDNCMQHYKTHLKAKKSRKKVTK